MILVLGATREAHELAERLAAEDVAVTTLRDAHVTHAWLAEHGVAGVVDAGDPFAVSIAAAAVQA
ncbi:MAG: Precorrin-6x reductase CbiJ/CobK, partial [Solirubrobacteraceae bacterium]|nr:Precorrin-6x reductase CbiJ/CobK [Solirubrobacteraceae bacterium]